MLLIRKLRSKFDVFFFHFSSLQWSFLQLGRPGAPIGGGTASYSGTKNSYSYTSYAVNSAQYQGNAVVRGLVFHRGKAATNAGMWDGRASGTTPDAFANSGPAEPADGPRVWTGAPLKSWWGVYLDDFVSKVAEYTPNNCAASAKQTVTQWTVTYGLNVIYHLLKFS